MDHADISTLEQSIEKIVHLYEAAQQVVADPGASGLSLEVLQGLVAAIKAFGPLIEDPQPSAVDSEPGWALPVGDVLHAEEPIRS